MTKSFRLLVCIILAISLLLSVCACGHEAPLPPTQAPTKTPTQTPTKAPTQTPTVAPTLTPTLAPTQAPTVAPSVYVPNPGGVGEDFDYVYWYERYLIAMGAKIHWRNIPQTGNNTVNVESIEEEIDVLINLPNFEGTINFSSIDIVGDLTIYAPKAKLNFGGEINVSGIITVKSLSQSGTEFDSEEIAEVATSEELSTAIEDGGIIVMTETIVLDTSGTKITNDTTIILNGNEISSERSYNGSDTSTAATLTVNGATLILKGDGIIANDTINDVQNYGILVDGGGTVIIEDGEYFGHDSAVYVNNGTAIIKGGFFQAYDATSPVPDYNRTWQGTTYTCYLAAVINCSKGAYNNYAYGKTGNVAKANVDIYGGTFVNEDPSNLMEGDFIQESHVMDGYTVVREVQENGDAWYTVIKTEQ